MSREDLTGKKFNKLTVIREIKNEKKGRFWECKCDCGEIIITDTNTLTHGKRKSCRKCANKRYKLTGKRFGRLVVLHDVESDKAGTYWLCHCDCGNEKVIKGGSLVEGKTLSCGCLNRDINLKRITKHGKNQTRLYTIWLGMKERCSNPNLKAYKYYGGKGIKICEEWSNENGFMNFYNWSIANGYSENLSIDRINSDGDYEPSNCRWATSQQQINNRSCTVYMTFKGETKPISEWSKITGLPRKILYYRKTHNWEDEKALTTPINQEKSNKKENN